MESHFPAPATCLVTSQIVCFIKVILYKTNVDTDSLHLCNLCSRGFKRLDILKRHTKRVHNEDPVALQKHPKNNSMDNELMVHQPEPETNMEVNLTSEMEIKSPQFNASDTYSWLSDFSPLEILDSVPRTFDPNDVLWLFLTNEKTPPKETHQKRTPTYPFSDTAMDLLVAAASENVVEECDQNKHQYDIWEQVKNNVVDVLFGVLNKNSNILPNSKLKDFVDLDFFRPLTIERLFQLYFRIFHDHFPILHKPTFSKNPETIPPLLVVSIITLGAFHDSVENYKTAVELHENFRWMVFSSLDLIPPKLWVIQTLALIQAFEKMASTRRQHELSATFHSAVITLLRRDGSCANMRADKEPAELNTLQRQWDSWIEKESIKRCVFFFFMMDVQHAVLFGHTSIMTINEIRLDLPCDEELWKADNHIVWIKQCESRASNKEYSFLEVLRLLLNEKLLPGGLSAFTKITLLHGLLSVVWCIKHGQGDSQVSPTSIVEILERAIETWSFSIMSRVPSLTTDVSRSLHRIAYITLHTSETSVLDLLTFSGSNSLTGRPLTEADFIRAKLSVEKWLATKQSVTCLVHALISIHQIEYAGNYYGKDEEHYSAKSDKIALRPWCIYISTIVVWAFCFFRAKRLGIKLRPPPTYGSHDECFLKGEEFIVRTLRDAMALSRNEDDEAFDNPTDFKIIFSVLVVVRESLKDCRWEMMHDAHYCLGKLVGVTQQI